MLKFKEFIKEAFLIEGRVDDLKAQNPGLHREIDQYAAADTTPTKKFVPWLVSQHKRGNVTPDHPDLHQVIQNFDRYKTRHGIKDHSSKSFQDVHAAVMPLIGTGATKREMAHEGRLKIHDTGDVQAYHIQTKKASQHFYGGGPEAGPTNTTWCVAARSEKCLFEKQYGKMYTIHANNDPDSPYAVHPEKNLITTRHNDGDKNIDSEIQFNNKIAKLKPVIEAIKKHHDPFGYKLQTANDLSSEDINHAMSNEHYRNKIALNPNSHIVIAALNHPDADNKMTQIAAKHPNLHVVMAAVNHSKANSNTFISAIHNNNNEDIALTALKNPKANHWVTYAAANHSNPNVVIAALRHSNSDEQTTYNAAYNSISNVVKEALNHSKADSRTTKIAAKHADSQIALTALNHPKADSKTIEVAAEHPDPQVALAALNHPDANDKIFHKALNHPNQQVKATSKKKLGIKIFIPKMFIRK